MDKPKGEGNRLLLLGAALTAALLVVYFGYSFTGEPPFWSLDPQANVNFTLLYHFLEKVVHLAGAATVLFASFAGGLFLVGKLRVKGLPPVEEAVWATGLGLGTLSLATLGLGAAGILTSEAAVGLLAIMVVVGLRPVRAFGRRAGKRPREPLSFTEKALSALAAAAAVVTVVHAFAPPMDFDVLEYHLAAPAHFFKTGSIRYISYNAYSNFPLNAEMLSLFSMTLAGSKLSGAMLGKVVNACVALAAAGAAFSLGKWVLSRGAGIFAAAALLGTSCFFHVAAAGYVEPMQVLYTLLALVAAGRFIQKGSRSALVSAGIFAGLAMGVKYPAALFAAAPLALAVLVRRGAPVERLKNFALFSGVALAVVAPWLAKNLVFTGNPVYPLLYSVFGGRDWSPLQDARWAFAHTPKGGLAWEQWARHVFGVLFSSDMITALSFIFVPFVFIARRASRRAVYVLAYGAFYILLWFAATHRIERFLLPGLAALGAVSGAGLFSIEKGLVRRLMAGLAIGLATLNVFYIGGLYGKALGLDLSVPLFGDSEPFLREKLPGYEAWQYLNANVPKGARVLLVAEAETFYLDVDFDATTVFDVKPFERMALAAESDPETTAEALKSAGFDYVFVNWATLRRQQETYGFSFEGKSHPGYSAVVTPELFDAMERAGVLRKVYSSGPDAYPGTPAYCLYQVE